MKSIVIFVLVLSIVISCSENAVNPPLQISVTKDNHSATYNTWAMLNIKNETSRDVYFTNKSDRIGFWKLEKAFGDRWIDVSTDTSFCRSLSTIEKVTLASGDKLIDSVLILKAGRYRMGFPFAWDENEAERDEISPEEFIVE